MTGKEFTADGDRGDERYALVTTVAWCISRQYPGTVSGFHGTESIIIVRRKRRK
jgi:hypothetical protein